MGEVRYLDRGRFDQLLSALSDSGYQVIAPQVVDGAIVYGETDSLEQLPQGVGEQQLPGHYRLLERGDQRLFAWSNGPQALRPILFPPSEVLWRTERDSQGHLSFHSEQHNGPPQAVVGVRPCDLAALELSDRHFLEGGEPDPGYRSRREGLFLLTVNCTHPSTSCFCLSTGDGPVVEAGGDLLLDELEDGYLVSGCSEQGQRLLDSLDLPAATSEQLQVREQQRGELLGQPQQRTLPEGDIPKLLSESWHSSHWQAIAERCLACGNCTSVCPTCFCHTEFDSGSLDINRSERIREWDSCFGAAHSYIHGTVIRSGIRQRYRQWLGHKFSGWVEQFGRSGCVGCGRCITWCPVGIEVTEELAQLCGGPSND